MILLLIPLLAAIALPTAVNTGNLGLADKILNGVNATKLEVTKQIYDINVGQINGKATAEFSNGKFIIKTDEKYIKKMQKEGRLPFDIKLNESGITPEQVISYDYQITRDRALFNIVYTLFYVDTNGDKQLASWGIGKFEKNSENMAKNFNDSFLKWVSNK